MNTDASHKLSKTFVLSPIPKFERYEFWFLRYAFAHVVLDYSMGIDCSEVQVHEHGATTTAVAVRKNRHDGTPDIHLFLSTHHVLEWEPVFVSTSDDSHIASILMAYNDIVTACPILRPHDISNISSERFRIGLGCAQLLDLCHAQSSDDFLSSVIRNGDLLPAYLHDKTIEYRFRREVAAGLDQRG